MAEARRENRPSSDINTMVPAKESSNTRKKSDVKQRREANRRVTVMKATEIDTNLAINHLEMKSKLAVSSINESINQSITAHPMKTSMIAGFLS